MQKESLKKIGIVAIFAIAMGFLEAVIVIYLRKIYYPLGFNFPLKGFISRNRVYFFFLPFIDRLYHL